MPPPITPSLLGRRLVVSGLAAATAGASLPTAVGLAQTTSLLPTPQQTTGPFYPVDWSGDADADLVRVAGEAARAQGVVITCAAAFWMREANPCRAQWWRSGSATPSATTGTRVIGQRGATRVSRGVGGSQRGRTAATPSAPSGRSHTLGGRRTSMSR